MPNTSLKKIFIRFHLIFAILVALAILAVGLFFFILPHYQETITSKKQEIAFYDRQLEERLKYFKSLTKLKDDYDSIGLVEQEKLGLVLPGADEIPELFLALDTIINESGLELSSINYVEAAPPPESSAGAGAGAEEGAEEKSSKGPDITKQIKTLEISLDIVGGSYDKLKIFLNKLEKNTRLLDIQSIAFENSFESITILLNAYYHSLE